MTSLESPNTSAGTAITGIIEVILEDKQGNVKRKETVTNSMTQATFAQMLFAGLGSSDALNDLFWIHKSPQLGQFVKVAQSSPLCLYCLTDGVTINPRQVYRNYLKSSQFTMYQTSPSDTSKVPFYVDAFDALFRLYPHLRNCAIDDKSMRSRRRFCRRVPGRYSESADSLRGR